MVRGLIGAALLLHATALSAEPKTPLTVFAAASLTESMQAVGQAYTARTGVPVRFSFAASSILARQLEAGARADMFVQGKGKSRKLVAPKSVGEYLNRVRELSKATAPDDSVFTIINGKPAKYLYSDTVQALLVEAGLVLSHRWLQCL